MGLDQLSHAELLELRRLYPQYQDLLAPFEHRAFAREYVRDNPLNAVRMVGAVPGYQLMKLLGTGARSQPSLDQVFAGYQGTLEGLLRR